jgi:hypothetical protein
MQARKVVLPLSLGLLFAGALRADAGQREPAAADEVTINVTDHWAIGTLAAARASADSNQWISCAVVSSGGTTSTFCYAMNSVGTIRSCASNDPAIANVATAVNGDSKIQFNWDGKTSTCTTVYVDNSSRYAPKAP